MRPSLTPCEHKAKQPDRDKKYSNSDYSNSALRVNTKP